MTPFRAGPQAVADEELDRVSMMLIKGLTESLQAAGSAWTVTDEAAEADYVVEGYIEEFSLPGKVSGVLRKKRTRLSVSGEVYRQDSQARVLTFATFKNITRKNFMDASYQAGKSIGDFILAQSARESL